MIVYISGPMTGIDNFNREAFFAAERALKAEGYAVLNPASLPDGLTYGQCMDIAMAMVRSADMLFMLPGWSGSNGAMAEQAYAASLGKPALESVPYRPKLCNYEQQEKTGDE